MTYDMNEEARRQSLASKLVEREIYYCVSGLVSTLSTLLQHVPYEVQRSECLSWEEDILPLMESIDYEEAGTQHVNDCDDLCDLETMADNVGYWTDAIEMSGWSDDTEYADSEGEMDTIDFTEWFDDHCTDDEREGVLTLIRDYITKQVGDWEAFCIENDVETDDFRSETYEFWIVSDWLAHKLKARGYTTGELCGLTIWGRCCTGQAICLDHVIQEIAMETFGEEQS